MLRSVLCSLLLALAFPLPQMAEDNALIKQGDFWRVFPVFAGGAEPGPTWTQLSYSDAHWQLLQASFSTPYFGNPGVGEQTTFPEPTAPTYCFRKEFNIDDPSFIQRLTLRIDYESGFLAFINGIELKRRGFPPLPAKAPVFGAPAQPHARFNTEFIDMSPAIQLLRTGKNVLAIQLHNGGPSFPRALLNAELFANFTRGPFIQSTSTNSTQVSWLTQTPSTGFVVYGKGADDLRVVFDELAVTDHAVTLPGLEPNETYHYRVYTQFHEEFAFSEWASFRTLKMPGTPISFIVIGDTGQATTPQYKIADLLKKHPTDLLMHVGDIVYPYFSGERADARCFSIYREHMRSTPFFFCMGNHDGYGKSAYLAAMSLPTNSMEGTELYYSFDHGDAHFIVLDTANDVGASYEVGSPQYRWLDADLAATTQPWKFIFFHHVIRSSSLHSDDDYLFNGIKDKYELQNTIGQLASRHGAQIIFTGHDHDYERLAAMDGVSGFVTGGGGAVLYGQANQEEGSVQFHMRHHFLKVNVEGPDLTVQAIDDNGVVFDRFYRSLAPTGPGPFAATLGMAFVEGIAGSDSAGNIPNQTFNFTGPSLRTLAGARANLGRIHVRHDRDFLYIGFESATLWRDQVIALFLENPAQPGITDLAPLGDNQLGQGADGLDMLSKLSFRNFRPSVACLLGDEQADATLPNFKRANMRWATGQGVFKLDQTFTPLPNARLQQFDRSPQTPAPVYLNSDADFIEVAIPLSDLGDPQNQAGTPTIKLGAIAFTDPAEGPMEPLIDGAFAGAALEAGPEGVFTLEPTVIQLASYADPLTDAFDFTAEVIAAGKLRFKWNSMLGALYTIQFTPALGQAFQDIDVPALPVTSISPLTLFDLTIETPLTGFYRLRAL